MSISNRKKEHTFHIDFTSKEDGENYKGTFTARKPSIMTQLKIEGIKSSLLDGRYYDPEKPGHGVSQQADFMADIMAFLKVCIVEAPDWFWEDDFSDVDLMMELYREAATVEPFRYEQISGQKTKREAVGRTGEASDSERVGTDNGDRASEMVD